MKDLRGAKKILGMEIVKDMRNGFLYLIQRRYMDEVLKRFSKNDAKVCFYSSWLSLLTLQGSLP